MLQLQPDDGQTALTLRSFDVDELLALRDNTSDLPEEETQVEPEVIDLELAPAEGADGPLAADLPLAADAQEVNQDDSFEQITYTSPSDIKTLAEFYRQELTAQGWSEDETFSMVEDLFATMDFEQGEASLTVGMFNDGFSGATEVTLSGSGLVWGSGDAGDSEVTTFDSETSPYTIADWPVPPEATEVSTTGNKVSYTINWDLPTIAEFYRPTFLMMDLSDSCLDDAGDFTSLSCSTSDGQVSLNVFFWEKGENESEVEIEFTNFALDDSGDDMGGDTGEVTLVDENDYLVPSNYTGYSSEGSEYSKKATVTSPSEVETLTTLYQTELAAQGWTALNTDIATEANLSFEKEGQQLVVNIKPTGSETEVSLNFRDPVAAKEAGILPASGKSRLYLPSIMEEDVQVTVAGQTITVSPSDPAMESPAELDHVDLAPGSYEVTANIPGLGETTETMELKGDEVWMAALGPGGFLPLQLY
jgi:hypothetical protein